MSSEQAGLEEPIHYDQAILADEAAYITLPSRVLAPDPAVSGAGFFPVPASGIWLPRKYLAAWGARGFLVFNRGSEGQRVLRIQQIQAGGRSLQFRTTLLEQGRRPKRQWLRGTSQGPSSIAEDGVVVEVTARGVAIRPQGQEQLFLQRIMTPSENRLNRLRRKADEATEQRDWTRMRLASERAQRLKRRWPRSRQSPWARRTFDLVEIARLNMLMRRRMPDSWFTGDPLPVSFEKDLWKLLTLGQSFLRQSPDPAPEMAQVVRAAQAQAVMYMAASGALSRDRSRVEYLLTDPRIPKGHVFMLLFNLWMSKALREATPDGKLDFDAKPIRWALAYALLEAAMPSEQHLSGSHYDRSPDSLLGFLPGGLSFPEAELERGRQAVRRIIARQLWDPASRRTGKVPQDLLEESLMPYPAGMLELAAVAAHVLAVVSDELGIPEDGLAGGRGHFLRLAADLERRRVESVRKAPGARLGVMNVFRAGDAEILVTGLGTPGAVVQWLRDNMERLHVRHDVEPKFDPEWVVMDFGGRGAHWLALGPVRTWSDQNNRKIQILLNILEEYGGPYRIQLREARYRRDRWVRVLELEITDIRDDRIQGGLEEMQLGEFLERSATSGAPGLLERIPAGAARAWVAPLPSQVSLYAQGPAMTAGLEERFRKEQIPGVSVRIFPAPLPAGQRYERPGVVVKDAALEAEIENPQQLLVLTLWLSDLSRLEPAALILAALGGLQDPSVKILGAMIYQNAQGQAMLVVFA